jgi:hypothetical protein
LNQLECFYHENSSCDVRITAGEKRAIAPVCNRLSNDSTVSAGGPSEPTNSS